MRDLLPLPPSPQGLVVPTGPDACLTVGPLLDEEVRREEAVRVFRQILAALDRVLEWPWTVVAASPDATPPPPGRDPFLPQLKRRGGPALRGAGGGGGG